MLPVEPLTSLAIESEGGVIDDTVNVVSVMREVVEEPLATVVVDLGEDRRKGGGSRLAWQRLVVIPLEVWRME